MNRRDAQGFNGERDLVTDDIAWIMLCVLVALLVLALIL